MMSMGKKSSCSQSFGFGNSLTQIPASYVIRGFLDGGLTSVALKEDYSAGMVKVVWFNCPFIYHSYIFNAFGKMNLSKLSSRYS